jgi:hypothetical protein
MTKEQTNMKHIVVCDRCNKINPIADECNFCPNCREDFLNTNAKRRQELKNEYEKFWGEHRGKE